MSSTRNANEPLNIPNSEVDRPELRGHGFVRELTTLTTTTTTTTTTTSLRLRYFTLRAYQVAKVRYGKVPYFPQNLS